MSLSVCEHTSVGVKAYSFVNGNWKALFAAVKSRVQLFQTGSVVLRSEQGEEMTLQLTQDTDIRRHQSESHSNCCEITHQGQLYLFKFQKGNDCGVFVRRAERFTKDMKPMPAGYEDDYAYSQRQPPATRQHAWEEPTSILPQALGQQNQRTQEPPYNQREPYDSYYNSDGFATRDPRYGRDPPGPRDPFSGTHSSQSVESGYATGVQHTGQRSHDHSFELGPQESPTNFPPVPPRTRLRNPQPMDHDDNIDNDYVNLEEIIPSRHDNTPADTEVNKAISDNMSAKDLKFWVNELGLAISGRNASESYKLVNRLIRYMDSVGSIELQCRCTGKGETPSSDHHLRLTVTVVCQHKESDETQISLTAKRNWKIKDLKMTVEQEYYLPRQVQRWMFGKQLVKDNDILGDLVGSVEEAKPFMYVVKAKKANLDRHTYENYMIRMGDQKQEQAHYLVNETQSLQQTPVSNTLKPVSSVIRDGAKRTPPGVQSGARPFSYTPEVGQPGIPAPRRSDPRHTRRGFEGLAEEYPEYTLPVSAQQRKPPPPAEERSHPPIFGIDVPVNSPDEVPLVKSEPAGWTCPGCTFVNKPMRPGCEICSTARPDSYRLPEDYTPDASERELMQKLNIDEQALEAVQKELEEERQKNLDDLMATDFKDYIENTEPFECPICIVEYEQGEGIVLRNCLHVMCKDCFRGHCINSDEADVKCPYVGDDYQCDGFITEREMRGLLTEEEFLKIEQKGLMKAEGAFANSFHCRTADCHGWCVYEDEVNEFPCPICNKLNCLLCKAIHEGMNCKEYQDDIARKAANDEAAKATKEFMERMVTQGDAMVCPSCGVIVQKKDGCDWIMCSVCKTELCWATKGPRWGPKGKGDLTGGCKCNFRGKRCHPKCRNCH